MQFKLLETLVNNQMSIVNKVQGLALIELNAEAAKQVDIQVNLLLSLLDAYQEFCWDDDDDDEDDSKKPSPVLIGGVSGY